MPRKPKTKSRRTSRYRVLVIKTRQQAWIEAHGFIMASMRGENSWKTRDEYLATAVTLERVAQGWDNLKKMRIPAGETGFVEWNGSAYILRTKLPE